MSGLCDRIMFLALATAFISFFGWQEHGKASAASASRRRGANCYATVMTRNNVEAEPQAQARPFELLGGKERLEDVTFDLGRNSGS